MEIIETIPIYTVPLWLVIITLISLLTLIGIFIFSDVESKAAIIVAIIVAITAVLGMILAVTGAIQVYDHDEYVIRLNDTRAEDFINKYEVTKTFKYSDVVQVKEK